MTTRIPERRVRAAGRAVVAAALAYALGAPAAGAENRFAWTAAPASARAKVNPYQGDGDAVRAGRKLFAQHCAQCHGEAGRGGGKAPPLASPAVAHAPVGEIFWFLTNGRLAAGMPAWSRLPEARRWQIVAFLATLDRSPVRSAP